MTGPRELDTGIGIPILARHARAEACAREAGLGLEPAAGPRCAHCGARIHFARFTFCRPCLERLPDHLRVTLYDAYRLGQVDTPLPATPKQKHPRPRWAAAFTLAKRLLGQTP